MELKSFLLYNKSGSLSFYKLSLLSTVVLESFHLYLKWRDYQHTTRAVKPTVTFAEDVTEDAFRSSKAYQTDTMKLGMVSHVVTESIGFAWKWYRLDPQMYAWAGKVLLQLRRRLQHVAVLQPYLQVSGGTHVWLLTVLSDIVEMLLSLPFAYYRHFVVESAHGFNKMTRMDFVKDQVKSLLLRVVLLHPIENAFVLGVVRYFGRSFPFYFTIGALLMNIAAMYIVPVYILPLFNKYTPVPPESSLYVRLQELCERCQFPLKEVFVVDGSRRSEHANAYVMGFGKIKRVVLYDTLLQQLSEEEVVAVVAHELSHWKHMDIAKSAVLGLVQMMVFCYGSREFIFNPSLVEDFGYQQSNPLIGFSVFTECMGALTELFNVLQVVVVRRCEYRADAGAVQLGYADLLKSSLKKLSVKSKQVIPTDWLCSMLLNNHPETEERVDAIDRLSKSNTEKEVESKKTQ